MRILIIDDDKWKSDYITQIIQSIHPNAEIIVKRSYQSGLYEIYCNQYNNPYDYLILDMQFPLYDDGTNMSSEQGLHVLAEMQRKYQNADSLTTKVIICSSGYKDYKKYDYGNVIGYILFDTSVHMNEKFSTLLQEKR